MSRSTMPTAGKLVACLAFGAVGFWVGTLAIATLTEISRIAYLAPLGAVVGAGIGWIVVGPDMSQGVMRGLSSGLKGAVFFAINYLLIVGIVQMLRLSVRGHYDGPMEALTDVVGQAIEIATVLSTPTVVGALFIGGAVAGMVGAMAGGRWS